MHFSAAGIAILISVAAAAPAPQGGPGFSIGNGFRNTGGNFGSSLLSRPQNFGTDSSTLLNSVMSNPRVSQFLQTRPDLQNADQQTLLTTLQQQFPDLFSGSNTNLNSFLSTDSFDPSQFESQQWRDPNSFSGGGGFKRRIKRDASSPSTNGGFDPFQQLRSVDPNWGNIDDSTFQNSLSDIGPYLQNLQRQDPQSFLQILQLLGPAAFQQSYDDKVKREAAAEDVAKE